MKFILGTLILLFASTTSAQMSSSELLEEALIQLELHEDQVAMNLVADENISELEAILVIPVINFQEEEISDYDVYILILNRYDGTITSRFFESNAWTTDAYRLMEIDISYQPFSISNDLEVIALTTSYRGSSSVVIFGSDFLSLFVKDNSNLIRILKDYVIYDANGEHDQRGNGQLETHDKTLEPIVSKKAFYDIEITNLLEKTVTVDAVEKTIERLENTETLKFENGQYVKSK